MKKFSELKVIFSNCLSGGTGWNTIGSDLIKHLHNEMNGVEGLEFKRVNSNTVRGEHNAFTLVLAGVFYNLKQSQDREGASTLLECVRNAANRMEELTYSEIRIEHTRHFSVLVTDMWCCA